MNLGRLNEIGGCGRFEFILLLDPPLTESDTLQSHQILIPIRMAHSRSHFRLRKERAKKE